VSGPIPKRDEERIRRHENVVPLTTVPMVGTVQVPELMVQAPHELVVSLWDSLAESGQAKYYEPSDWAYAQLTMHIIDGMLKSSRGISSLILSEVNKMMSNLLVTEGDRRRVRMEVARQDAKEASAKVIQASDMFRDRFKSPVKSA
jgi:hypothetical protein